ncbi:MAG: LysR family transcriptional regulator, partial [Eggerthellaceae bacterium]|nr:LysR family transcriptional regulator [Eggerthellaceae bacterium]
MRVVSVGQLECLVATIRFGSCKRAAEALCLTPQAVVKSLHSLERVLGGKLISGRGQSSSPTRYARMLAVRAQRVLTAVDDIQAYAKKATLTLGNRIDSLNETMRRRGKPMAYDHIFQPIRIGSKYAQNRIEIAPAAPFLAGHDGSLSPEFYEYNKGLASAGAGIVNLGVTSIDPGRGVGSRIMSIGSDLYLSDFNELAELFHSYGSLASCELVYSRYMLSPAEKVVNDTTTEEVEEMIQRFADAADRLVRANFDIAFIHGGHGNVPAMFFSNKINQRTDRFGGSFEGRCQFAVELLQAIRARVGKRLAITYRISAEEMLPGTSTLEETLEFAKVIEPYIDLLHVSRGILEVDDLLHYIFPPLYLPRGMNLPFAKRFKEELSIPVTVVGGFNLELAEQV